VLCFIKTNDVDVTSRLRHEQSLAVRHRAYRPHTDGRSRLTLRHGNTTRSFLTPKLTRILKPEGHSVERIYLRQRCSDGSVNKTILKPRLAVAARLDFPDVKFRVAVHIRYRRKQSGSGIRAMIRIWLKS